MLPNAAEVDEVVKAKKIENYVKEKRFEKHMKRFKSLVFARMQYVRITNGRFKTTIRA
ncbi:MAG: hypothetical protein WAZ77_07735 [Candidatus Nitrosopolaris sp.]